MGWWTDFKNKTGEVIGTITGAEAQKEAARAQLRANREALEQKEKFYEETKGYVEPYYQTGMDAFNRMAQGVASGAYDPKAFEYSGGPVDRSIASYMQDDPGLSWQQEQLEKAINRQGAAQGRWGGGATGREMMREQAGLLAQDYQNRFARAQAERAADVGTEQQMYGRAQYANTLENKQIADRMAMDNLISQYGLQGVTTLANTAAGQGTSLAELALNRGNIQAQGALGEYDALKGFVTDYAKLATGIANSGTKRGATGGTV